MFINDYIEKIALQEELENVKEQLKAVQDENAKLKTTIDRYHKACIERRSILLDKNELIAAPTAEVHKLKGELNVLKYSNSVLQKNGAESLKEDEGFDNDQINISDEDFLKYQLSNREGKIEELKAKVEMLENDRKEGLLTCCNCSHSQQYRIKQLEDELSKSNAEKQELETKIVKLSMDTDKIFKEKRQEGDNLRNRVKDLEAEIDQLKSNPSTVSDSELLAIHTADVDTINKLNIKARDLNSTISTLLERVSKSDEENQELKKKVQELKDIIKGLSDKIYN